MFRACAPTVKAILTTSLIVPLTAFNGQATEPCVASPSATIELVDRASSTVPVIKVPDSAIASLVNHSFDHKTPVDRVILGTHSVGVAHCTGVITCNFADNSQVAELNCHVSGTVTSRTMGVNGPARIQAMSRTNYVAIKKVFFDGQTFSTLPTVVNTDARVRVTNVDSELPGVRGLLVRRVASRKASESKRQVEAITSAITRQELARQIDREFDAKIAVANHSLADFYAWLSSPQFVQCVCIRTADQSLEVHIDKPRLTALIILDAVRSIRDVALPWVAAKPNPWQGMRRVVADNLSQQVVGW